MFATQQPRINNRSAAIAFLPPSLLFNVAASTSPAPHLLDAESTGWASWPQVASCQSQARPAYSLTSAAMWLLFRHRLSSHSLVVQLHPYHLGCSPATTIRLE